MSPEPGQFQMFGIAVLFAQIAERKERNLIMQKELHEENRRSWNVATDAHNSHKGDQASFFRNGGNKLYLEEKELLGDITGLSVVHLLCNAGQDTLSLAQMGAVVTGVDISDTAIAFARTLSADSGVPAAFYRMDVYDWFEEAAKEGQQFDLVFCSYGAIHWLSNLSIWARGVATVLKTGGRFITVDYHPVMAMFDEHLNRKFPYFRKDMVVTMENGIPDYVAARGKGLPNTSYVEGIKDFQNPYRAYRFPWGIGEIITALLEAGLRLTHFQEYPHANGDKPFLQMENSGHSWSLPDDQPNMPLMYAIVADKPL
jgi:SAM-dependent methyltransferase